MHRVFVVGGGYVDLQCNGAAGIDLTSDPAMLWDVGAELLRFGITALLPTLISIWKDRC